MTVFGAKPYIIAEVGSNFLDLDGCLRSIEVAKECGANAAKFQMFDSKTLFGFHDGIECLSIPPDWLPTLAAKCADVGIDFGCTAFSPELVKAVDPYVKWHKVASSDAAWPQLLEAVKACGKPVLLSTGGKTDEEVVRASHMLAVKVPVVRLVCVAAYPADYVNLDPFVSGTSGLGFSDHTLGYTATVEAARCGAVVIEKHFTAFPDLETPDRPHSLTPAQFTRMVDIIRGKEFETEEGDMYRRHNRRLLATRDVAQGETLKYGENFGAYRSLHDDIRGASPWDWEKLEGKETKVALVRGQGIRVGDVE
jgi:sialic acid synthase SpsE